jgi:hypothetical protein
VTITPVMQVMTKRMLRNSNPSSRAACANIRCMPSLGYFNSSNLDPRAVVRRNICRDAIQSEVPIPWFEERINPRLILIPPLATY